MREMEHRNIAICTTTIFPIRTFLEEYRGNIIEFGHEHDVRVYIAGDNKSPAECAEDAASASRDGLQTVFLSIEDQRQFLRQFDGLEAMIPENSDNRRNVAYLAALSEGADLVISVDDDNFPMPGVDFVGEHLVVGRDARLPEAVGRDGWYNLCDLLVPHVAGLYPRGFPYKRRADGTNRVGGETYGTVGVNVGLWRDDPDTDAIGRLYAKPHIDRADGRTVLLGRGVRCPINTQNTAVSREAMAAYYYVRMGEQIRGMRLDRFGDIFSGYFLQVCADAVGDRIRIGTPVADHRRNSHNLLVDLYHELAGIMILEDMAEFLTTVELPGDSYAEAYEGLSHRLEEFADAQEGFVWGQETRQYMHGIAANMRAWADVVESLVPAEAVVRGARGEAP